jgi:hypothetical protein
MTEGQRQGFNHGLPLGLLVASAIGLMGFIWLESRLSQPMLDLSLFRNSIFSLSLLTGWLVFMALGGSSFLIPFYLQLVLHYSIEHIGLLMAFTPVIGGLILPLARNLTDCWRDDGDRGGIDSSLVAIRSHRHPGLILLL